MDYERSISKSLILFPQITFLTQTQIPYARHYKPRLVYFLYYSPWCFHYFHPGVQKLSYPCFRRYFSLFCRQPISNYGQSAGSKLLPWPRRTTQSFRWGQRLYNTVFESSINNFPKNQEFPKNSQDFENIQFPTSHLEAENPFGLVFSEVGG